MTSVRPVAAPSTDGLPTAKQSRGSGDLFAGLLEIAGSGPSTPVRPSRQSASIRPSTHQPSVRDDRGPGDPAVDPAVAPAVDHALDHAVDPALDPALDPADAEGEPDSADDPATAPDGGLPIVPPVFDIKAALEAGMAAARIALSGGGRAVAEPTGGTEAARPPVAGTRPGLAGVLTTEALTGRFGVPSTALWQGGAATAGAAAAAAAGTTAAGAGTTAAGAGTTTAVEGRTPALPGEAPTTVAADASRSAGSPATPADRAVATPDQPAVPGPTSDAPTTTTDDLTTGPAPEAVPGAVSDAGRGAHEGDGDREGHDRRDHQPSGGEALAVGSPQSGEAFRASDPAVSPDSSVSAQPAGTPSSAAAPSASAGVTGTPVPATGALGAATAGNVPGRTAGSSSSVTGQVIPEVTRMVTRGDGTQRVTVKLAPEALGEVRIILTVRRGEVHVRMSGSEAAQQALLQGQSDLHRLLAGAGATSSSIQVGDQVATLANASGTSPENAPGSRDGSTGQPGSDVRRDASGQQSGGDAGSGARTTQEPGTPADRRPGGPAAPQTPTRRQSSRLDVSV